MKKKLFSLLLVMFMLLGFVDIKAEAAVELESHINSCADFLVKNNNFDPWQIPSLLKLNKLNDAQKNNIKKDIDDNFDNCIYSTDIAKNIFVLRALGYDVQNYNGHDLVNEMLAMGDYLGSTNYEVWVLSAAVKGDYKLTDDSKKAIDNIVADVLKNQAASGGFAYSYGGQWVDVDCTGMALYALSPYKERGDVQESVKKGIKYIKDAYNNGQIDNSNTLAMAILGLYPYGEVTDNMISDLLSYQREDGSFTWKKDNEGSVVFASEQALYTLTSYKYGDVFDFRNAESNGSKEENKEDNKQDIDKDTGNTGDNDKKDNVEDKNNNGQNAGNGSNPENKPEESSPAEDSYENKMDEYASETKTGDVDICVISSLCLMAMAGIALGRKKSGAKICRK